MRSDVAIRPTRVEVDLGALRHNARVLGRIARTAVFAVVKADAYGHGAVHVARALAASGDIAGFAVSLVEEGSRLRDAGIEQPILVMGPALAGGYDELVARRMIAVISDPQDLEGIARAAGRGQGRVAVHLKIDTGMGRLGFLPERLPAVIERIRALGHLDIQGVCTHFACADTDDPLDSACMTHAQLRCFDEAVAALGAMGIRPALLHTANSSATLRFPSSRRDLVRCGLALYGNGASLTTSMGTSAGGALRQALRIVSHVAQLRQVRAGATVSYGALWRAPRDARLAVLPIGYADGIPRRVTGKAEVLIAGQRCPLVGAVSMDISIADVTVLGDAVEIGDEVILLGAQGAEQITTRQFAAWADVTEYEVTCGISVRVPRVHVAPEERPV